MSSLATSLGPITDLKDSILSAIGRHLELSQYKIFVFGSRVSGRAHPRSDIDVGIQGGHEIPLYTMGAIKEELENLPTLYTIDTVDIFSASPQFRSVALKNIIPLN